MQHWPLQNAKAELSKVVRLAMNQEPQAITLRGEDAVVVLSKQEYDTLTSPKVSFWELMQSSPLKDAGISCERDHSLVRDVAL